MSVRPRLKNHVRALRRSPDAVQFGLLPDTGLVVEGLSEDEITLVEHLDGSLDHTQLYAVAQDRGVSAARLDLLLAELRRHRLLVEDPTDRADLCLLERAPQDTQRCDADGLALAYRLAGDGLRQLAARRRRYVLVGGSGSLPEAVCALLLAGGVGRVDAGAAGFDAAVQALSPGRVEEGSALVDRPDLVLLPANSALPPGAGAPWWRHGIPHLPVVAQGHRVVIGPLVLPGAGPCLDCLDLHRRDRDPAWPALLTQLAPPLPGPSRPVEAESTLTATAAGLVAMVAHGHLDGLRLPVGVSLELNLPWPWLTHREWTSHPGCTCTQ
jgi:hypothetical protein